MPILKYFPVAEVKPLDTFPVAVGVQLPVVWLIAVTCWVTELEPTLASGIVPLVRLLALRFDKSTC